jgi:hypothetical protein
MPMSLLETQNFLARIYTDENLRRGFLSEPEKVGRANNLSETEIAELTEVFPEELNSFAQSLFYKRLREVEKFLPLTRKSLGENFENYFRIFADLYLPSTVKKHLEDAVEFCGYLQKDKSTSDIEKNTAKFEQAKLEFYGFEKPLVIKIFDYDIKTNQKRKYLAVWLRIGSRTIVF